MFAMNIGRKLMLASAVVGLCAAGTTYNQWSSNRAIGAATETVSREQTILGGIARAQLAMSRIELRFAAVQAARTPAEAQAAVAAARRDADEAAAGLERPIALALKPDVLEASRQSLQRLADAVQDYAERARADLAGGAVPREVEASMRKAFTDLVGQGETMIGRSVANARNFAGAAEREAFERIAGASRIGLLAGLLMLLGLVGAAVFVLRNVQRPLRSLVGVLERMAAGEIDAEIREAARADEIGALGRAVENIKAMVARKAAEEAERRQIAEAAAAAERRRTRIELADAFERTVGGIVARVSDSAAGLQGTAQGMTATATQTADRSTAVASAAEEAATNVQTVASAAEELGSSVDEIGRQVSGSAELAQRAVAEAGETTRLVQALNDSSSQIGEMVGLISNIASQTNLLALNATIEAARAGEAGRGFAVVATEVKELANQTTRATEDIGRQIGEVQAVTGRAVTAIGDIAARIREIDHLASGIASAVAQQGAATQEIVRNVTQAASGTGAVTRNIAGVASAAKETGAAAGGLLAAASDLSRQSDQLGGEVSRFLATIRAA